MNSNMYMQFSFFRVYSLQVRVQQLVLILWSKRLTSTKNL